VGDREKKAALFEQFARVGKALGHGKRLELIDLLAQGERSVESLTAAAGLGLSTASAHLQALKQAGLVTTRRDGARILIDARDDGAGSPHVVAGNGLTGMRERLAQYGGELRIETQRGQGFCLHIALPVSETPPALAPLPVSPPEPIPELSSGGTP